MDQQGFLPRPRDDPAVLLLGALVHRCAWAWLCSMQAPSITASAASHAAHLPADRVQTLHATVHATNLAWYWSWLSGRLWALCVGSQGLAQIHRENQLLRQELDQANRLLAAPDRPALDAALASGLKVAAMLGCAGFVC